MKKSVEKDLFPIKHVLIFSWSFNEVTDLYKVAENLTKELFYVLRAGENILVATSRSKPAVIFVILQRDPKGGELILIQTHEGWYNYGQLKRFTGIFGKKAGIKVTPEL